MKFCKDCKYYEAGKSVEDDGCRNARAIISNSNYWVRGEGEPGYHGCKAMRAGICADGQLHEPIDAALAATEKQNG